ncbi:type I-C CRISPR-associated protein Cas8c/Csd1 [Moraxella sp. FZFQ2102]|uniref:type I-C CRISPR-associated protein Cas8c/Csd1 n=1 Tax=Moraxella sp. FZFQ2102 TaxID=2953752 RepID=UPI00209BE8DE|nr:type I-C CRISPR-associated protein Cas8c/Csd1 [Moraxella sp. FZFQ2102]USZ14965.1 type I-C CRISPR-associated protein Cas8c/Csd1 [Moraxella sp. FZFQ2102]
MSWMQKLYRTYEFVQNQGLDDEELALPFHLSKAVHLKVVLNDKAELVRAERFEGKKQVPIQVTEKSSKRSGSTIAAYALHDGLQYIAKTAKDYLTIEYLSQIAPKRAKGKGGKKWQDFLAGSDEEKQNFADAEKAKYQSYFECYGKQLSDWAEFSGLQEINIVLRYVQKGSLIDDLIEKKYFSFEDNILMSGKDDPFGLTIVWAVDMPSDPHSDLWSKSNIKSQWIKYQESQSEQGNKSKELCYITGEEDYPVEAYPKIDGNAKVVSANDYTGFTFRGRFYGDRDNGAKSELGSQAVILGRGVSQKAFNMLKWLIKRQGICNGDQKTVVWAISGKEVPSPMKDSFGMIDWDNLDTSTVENEEEMPSETNISGKDWSSSVGQKAAEIIKKKLHGYRVNLENHEQISLLVLDKSTDGRMALTYYQEFLPADYFANLDAWIDDFSWYQRHSIEKPNGKKSDKQTLWVFVPPSPAAIGYAVYGQALSDTLKKQLYARLLPVIAGGKNVPIPYYLVQKSFQVACNPYANHRPEGGEKIRKANWQRNIGVACALYKGWRARHHDLSQRRTYLMSLDTENRSRDYLFGRLLAIAENIESYALYLAEEKRATTAERYMQRFAEHPFATWRNIELALKPYQDRLRSRGKDTGTQAIGEIMELFQRNDFICDDKLSGEFLLGYHCQKMEINRQIAERKAAKQKKTKTAE